MYCNHFGLRIRPFQDRADTQFFLPTAECEETLAAMEYEAHQENGVALVVGEAGVGKTLLVRSLLMRLDASDHVVVLTWPAGGKMNVVREACKGFGVTIPTNYNTNRCLARLRRHLNRTAKKDQRCVLIIDQAEHLGPDQLRQIMALIALQQDGSRSHSLILIGQPQFKDRVEGAEFASIRQRLFGARALSPLDVSGTHEYIRHRLSVAGVGDRELFDRRAVEMIHDASSGVPRLINHLCDTAMIAAYGAGLSRIDQTIVAEVTSDGDARPASVRIAKRRDVTTPETQIEQEDPDPIRTPTEDVREVRRSIEEPVTSGSMEFEYAMEKPVSFAAGDDGRFRASSVPPSAPAVQTGDMDRMFSKGEALLERLERALARADRMSTTAEASLLQSVAVEKHLASLMENADCVSHSVNASIQRASESLGELENRSRGIQTSAQEGLESLERRLDRLPDVAEDIDGRHRQVEETCRRAELIESNLKTVAEQLADRADDVQERLSVVMAGIQSSEDSQDSLASTLSRASKMVTEVGTKTVALGAVLENAESTTHLAQSTLDHLRTTMEDVTEQATRSQAAASEKLLATTERRINEIVTQGEGQLDGVASRCSAKIQSMQEEAALKVEVAEQARDSQEAASEKLLATTERRINEIVTQGEDKLDSVASRCSAKIQSMQEEAALGLDRVTAKSRQVQVLQAATQQSVENAEKKTEEIVHAAADVHTRVQAVQTELEELFRKADVATSTLAPSLERGESIVRHIEANRHEVDAAQRAVSTMLLDIGKAVQRAESAGEQLGGCEQVIVRLEAEGKQAVKRTEQLSEIVPRAEDVAERLHASLTEANAVNQYLPATVKSVVVEAEGKIGQLSSHVAAAGNALRDLNQANVDGRSTAEHVTDLVASSRRQVKEDVQQLDRLLKDVWSLTEKTESSAAELSDRQDQIEPLVRRIDAAVPSAREISDELSQFVVDAQGRIDEMIAQHKRAADAAERLAKLEEVLGEARDAEASIDGKVAQAREIQSELSRGAQRETERLTAYRVSVEELLERVEASTRPVREMSEHLDDQIKRAEKGLSDISGRCEQAANLAERVAGVSAALEVAKETHSATRATMQQANDLRQGLIAACEAAMEQSATLQEMQAQASVQMKTHAETDESIRKLLEQLESRTTVAEELGVASERYSEAFRQQVHDLGQSLHDMRSRAEQIEQNIASATAEPAKLLALVQSQSERLERVCAAVRKVFASLSKATLEGKEQTEEFRSIGQVAAARFAKLTAETERASQTLHEWIEEAVRAQSRLERAIDRSPGIRETHPGEFLTSMSRSLVGSSQLVPPARAGDLSMLPTPSGTEVVDERVAETPARTSPDEISALIEEAKQASTPSSAS